MLFSRLGMLPDLLNPNYFILDTINLIERAFAKACFRTSGVCRKSQEPRIRFYRLVGRVRTLRVPAPCLGALTEESP